jgi:carboxymethylenebutenolidase
VTTIEVTAADDHRLSAYEVAPDAARAGVVVIQEIFGVNDHIRSVVDRFAAAGYYSIAPALFDRVERGLELDYSQASIDKGRGIARGGLLPQDRALADITAAAEFLRVAGLQRIGVVGYCWGGYLATLASIHLSDLFAAAVAYYGGGTPTLCDSTPRIPLIMHFGANDHAIPIDDVRALQEAWANAPVEIHIYDGVGHGFNCDQRGSYDPAAATLALDRTLGFLSRHLGDSSAGPSH